MLDSTALTVTSFPDILFDQRNWVITRSSTVWLYCRVSSGDPSLTITWNRNNVTLTQNLPKVYLNRIDGIFESWLLLRVTNFEALDSGDYQCAGQVGSDIGTGASLELIGMHLLMCIVNCIMTLIRWTPKNDMVIEQVRETRLGT